MKFAFNFFAHQRNLSITTMWRVITFARLVFVAAAAYCYVFERESLARFLDSAGWNYPPQARNFINGAIRTAIGR